MQRVQRIVLQDEVAGEIRAYQLEVDRQRQDEGFSAVTYWDRRRQTRVVLEVLAALKRMAGAHQRCMYCVNSEAGDIEHFRPKTPYPEHMYRWENLLLCCGICGRKKGNQFPMADGQPLLIDPTSENPWEYLDFDPGTGNIVPRVEPISGDEAPKGRETVRVFQLEKRQALANGYKRTFNRLKELVEELLGREFAEGDVERLLEADDHGLLGWCFGESGPKVQPFGRFREAKPREWEICQQAFV